MAVKGLYPSLPSLILSSDEEEERISEDPLEVEDELQPVTSGQNHVTRLQQPASGGGGFCHSTVSLKDFEESYIKQSNRKKAKQKTSIKDSDPNHVKVSDSDPNSHSASHISLKWVWFVLYKWRFVCIGLLLGIITILLLGENEGQG